MNKYQIISGVHIEGGREYKAGQTVVSPRPLDKLFQGKFKDLGPTEAPKQEGAKPAPPPKQEGVKPVLPPKKKPLPSLEDED